MCDIKTWHIPILSAFYNCFLLKNSLIYSRPKLQTRQLEKKNIVDWPINKDLDQRPHHYYLDPCMSLLESSLLSRFSGIVNCRLFFLCFMSRIHLWVSTYICRSWSVLPHSICSFFLDPSICLQISRFFIFHHWVLLHCVNVPHF